MLFTSKYQPFPAILLLTFTLSVISAQPAAARRKDKSQLQQLSYQPAGAGSKSYSPASDPNRQTVSGFSATSRLTPAQQIASDLLTQKANLQRQVDALGAELSGARRGRARKITKELNKLAGQIAGIDRKLNNLPPSAFRSTAENESLSGIHHLSSVEEMIQQKMAEKSTDPQWSAEPVSDYPSWPGDPEPAPVSPSSVAYRVQVAVTNRSTSAASSDLGAQVTEVHRPDGKYAYYYGRFSSLREAQDACYQVRQKASYRDAFVIATRGDERITLEEAERMLR